MAARKRRLTGAPSRQEPAQGQSLAARTRRLYRNAFHGQHSCAGCGRDNFTNRFSFQSHRCIEMGGLWASKAARATGRKMGKAMDEARRHAARSRIAAGLTEVRATSVTRTGKDGKQREITVREPVRTPRGESRPELSGRVSIAQLRHAHRHHRDHDQADALHGRADRAEAAGDKGRAGVLRGRADDLHLRHGTRTRTRTRERD
jgi:hypothetical protein